MCCCVAVLLCQPEYSRGEERRERGREREKG
jgi:hypothetical protein